MIDMPHSQNLEPQPRIGVKTESPCLITGKHGKNSGRYLNAPFTANNTDLKIKILKDAP